ncbi:hypothetical protein KC19_3G152200 [Ceratodon purpureus]|uniref:TIR domain-containing protein n=1 Tax=Ceratodon purpureus TaxID=3225 RepID=A0A8T0IK49_CERPU|nr:hypothetical protein KC19_3G152200 [Ceratodon purpureus]
MNDCDASTSGAVTENFDVFLNHRGPDVKTTFVAHLEDALRCAGFRPFLDARSLMKGNPALKSIDQALDAAKVHVAVVSKRYAESKYCLNELVAMMRSGKPVIPVFYDVEPVDLRWVENGPFAEAFLNHKSKGRTQKKLHEWTHALGALADITGFCLANYKRDEAKLKREVVNQVARLAPSNDPVDVEPYRVGLQRRAHACIQMSDNMGAGTGILGLVGMGGVGKTTLAREIYNHFVAEKKFRNMTFLEIHRDSSTSDVEVRSTWVRELQKQLLWDLLRVQTSTSNDYSSWFRKVASVGPVLIVVDNVYKVGQFEALVPFVNDIPPGSRIIVTSRDRSVFNNVAGRSKLEHCLYDVSTLGVEESSMLFNWHAFQADEAPQELQGVAKDVVEGCGGLPLALKVVGSSLFDVRSDEDSEAIWLEAVHALRQNPDVKGVLKWSYDHLSKPEKHMFLDIACLFSNHKVEEALAYWRSCEDCTSCDGVHTPCTSLRSLVNKNLVIVHCGVYCGRPTFKVHDLLMDLGQEIGKKAKTHFVNGTNVEASIMKKQGTNKTLALSLVGSRKRKFEAEDFASMPNLHFLELPDGCVVNGDFRCISTKIRWLRWRGIVLDCMPLGLDVSCLTSLDFSKSTNLASLWTESEIMLKGFPNLLQLNLQKCTSITRLPNSIGQSSQLQNLYLRDCEKLKILPKSIGQLKRLQNLQLWGCSSLKGLPESIGQASGLHHVDLARCTKLKKLPESIGQLQQLQCLILDGCRSLTAIPDSIGALSNLVALFAVGCTLIVKLPPSIGLCSSLMWLFVHASAECQTFSDGHIGEAWSQLRRLQLGNCGGLGSLLAYGALKSLTWLTLEDIIVTELPESIGLLMGLWSLDIACERLQCLPNSIGDLKLLRFLTLRRCDNLKRLPKTLGGLTSLENLDINSCSIRKLPRSIGQLSGLRRLEMKGCKNLQKLPTSIRNLKGLRRFMLRDCGSVEAMGALTTLQGLPMWGTTSVTQLPASLGLVSTLVAYGDDLADYENGYRRFVGTSKVLEEDESGFLKVYRDESSGVTSLVRGIHEKQVSLAVLQVGV